MESYNLEKEYEYFLECLNETYCTIEEFSEKLSELFYEKCDFSNKITDDARKLENNLYYVEKITYALKDILDETKNVSFHEEEEIVEYSNNLLIFPIENYDNDLYVDPDSSLRDLWKHDD